MDDGVIKFKIDWKKGTSPDFDGKSDLMRWRNQMYQLGLIGFDETYQVGYGNISAKSTDSKSFVISGTQTGHIANLGWEYYTMVTDYVIDANALECIGPVKASSESLTHAAIYEADSSIKCIIHIHHNEHWAKLLGHVPTTNEAVPYGTPEMAYEIKRLFAEEGVKPGDIIAMAGHQGGLITFGSNLKEAAQPYLNLVSC